MREDLEQGGGGRLTEGWMNSVLTHTHTHVNAHSCANVHTFTLSRAGLVIQFKHYHTLIDYL